MARPAADPSRPDSRSRLLSAARAEFAGHGFAAASVDRIAAAARLNKAMIYYHFDSKAGLYHAVLQDMFRAVGDRVRPLRDLPVPAGEKLRAFITAFTSEALRRPDFPAVMLREIVEHGQNLDAASRDALLVLPETFIAIVREGVAAGEFRAVDPFIAYTAVIGPVALTLASTGARARLSRTTGRSLLAIGLDQLAPEVEALALAMLRAPRRAPRRTFRRTS